LTKLFFYVIRKLKTEERREQMETYTIKVKKVECEEWTTEASDKAEAMTKFHFGEATHWHTYTTYSVEVVLPPKK